MSKLGLFLLLITCDAFGIDNKNINGNQFCISQNHANTEVHFCCIRRFGIDNHASITGVVSITVKYHVS